MDFNLLFLVQNIMILEKMVCQVLVIVSKPLRLMSWLHNDRNLTFHKVLHQGLMSLCQDWVVLSVFDKYVSWKLYWGNWFTPKSQYKIITRRKIRFKDKNDLKSYWMITKTFQLNISFICSFTFFFIFWDSYFDNIFLHSGYFIKISI